MRFTRKKKKTSSPLMLAAIIVIGALLSFRTVDVQAQLPGIPEGVPRGDIIVYRAPALSAAPDNMNPWIPGNPNLAGGGAPHYEPLWYINVTNMETIPMLAGGMAEYNEDFTVLTIPIRRNVYWNDGVEFTAEDVAYSVNIHLEVDGLAMSASFQTWVERAYVEDKYTAVIELQKANPKYHLTFTNVLGMTGFLIMSKHVWENEDPLTFTSNPPVGTGPYVVENYDPNGYWMLWKRRDDWYNSALGKVVGRPKPRYLLRQHYTPADPKQVIAISKHEMDVTEVTMELWDTVRDANPYIVGFWKDFPYAWQFGICDHGVGFNNAKFPTNLTDVRWALTLAINMTEVNILALDAKGRIATFHSMSVPYLQVHFEDILLPWIKDFSLRDGYKPFDETIPQKIAAYAESQGYTLAAAPEDIYGPGWWKYDFEEAAKLLEDNGFTRDAQGRWLLPNGELWTVNLLIPAYHPMASRIGFAVAEQWRAFGVDVADEALTSGMIGTRNNMGEFDATVVWPWCGMLTDPWNWWQGWWHKKYYKPIGELATSNQLRFQNDEMSDLIDELGGLTPEDPRVIGIVAEIIKISFEEMPHINCYLGSKMIVSDTYVWENWNTGDNWYWERSYWNPMWCLPVLVNLEHTGNVPFTTEEGPVTTVTTTLTETATQTTTAPAETVTQTVTQTTTTTAAATTVTETEAVTETTTETVTAMDMTSIAGAGIVALIIGVIVGWLVASGKK